MPKLRPEHLRRVSLVPGYYAAGNGLYLAVGQRQSQSWVYRYTSPTATHANKHGVVIKTIREMGLGSRHEVGVDEARDLAYEARRLLRAGRDPLDERRATALVLNPPLTPSPASEPAMTVEDTVRAFIQAKKAGWTPKHLKTNWTGYMENYIIPAIGKMPIATLKAEALLGIIEPLWVPRHTLAQVLRTRIKAVMEYAIDKGLHPGPNPAKVMLHDLATLKMDDEDNHHPALHYKDIPEFMRRLRACDSVTHRLIEFVVLTGARRDEARCMPWVEFDPDEQWWNLPAKRTKQHKRHRVPLSTPALAILDQMQRIRTNEFVFAGMQGPHISETAVRNALKELQPGITLHGFRASFKSWATDTRLLVYPRELAEVALGHAVGSKVEQAYAHQAELLDLRRAAMADWAAYCAS